MHTAPIHFRSTLIKNMVDDSGPATYVQGCREALHGTWEDSPLRGTVSRGCPFQKPWRGAREGPGLSLAPGTDEEIPLPNVKTAILSKARTHLAGAVPATGEREAVTKERSPKSGEVIDYCKHHKDHPAVRPTATCYWPLMFRIQCPDGLKPRYISDVTRRGLRLSATKSSLALIVPIATVAT